jgi:hypothetical protein
MLLQASIVKHPSETFFYSPWLLGAGIESIRHKQSSILGSAKFYSKPSSQSLLKGTLRFRSRDVKTE